MPTSKTEELHKLLLSSGFIYIEYDEATFTGTLSELEEALMALIAHEVKEADKIAWEKLNTWLIEHDMANLDSSRISIKASDWLKEYANRLSELSLPTKKEEA